MKKISVLTILLLTSVPVYQALSQFSDPLAGNSRQLPFFIPQSELAPKYEKLPSIRPNNEASRKFIAPVNKNKTVQRYIAVDGRYIPVFADEPEEEVTIQEPQEETTDIALEETFEETPTVEIKQVLEDVVTPTSSDGSFIPEPQVLEPKKEVKAPHVEMTQPNTPRYKDIYNHYLDNLKIFQQTKRMPYDQELDDTLSKLNSNKFTIYFQDTINTMK